MKTPNSLANKSARRSPAGFNSSRCMPASRKSSLIYLNETVVGGWLPNQCYQIPSNSNDHRFGLQTEKWQTEKWQTGKWRTGKWRTEKWRTGKWQTGK